MKFLSFESLHFSTAQTILKQLIYFIIVIILYDLNDGSMIDFLNSWCHLLDLNRTFEFCFSRTIWNWLILSDQLYLLRAAFDVFLVLQFCWPLPDFYHLSGWVDSSKYMFNAAIDCLNMRSIYFIWLPCIFWCKYMMWHSSVWLNIKCIDHLSDSHFVFLCLGFLW